MPTKTGPARRYRRRDRRLTLTEHDTLAAVYVGGPPCSRTRPRVTTVTRLPGGVWLSINVTQGAALLTRIDLAAPGLPWPPPPRRLRRILRACP
ncbi:hypothetical protein ABT352_32850 [Streptosporangium sp. NPDC000563]|uniref:hypothetical protein n=1 Tax=Streptosporangium sp. NPDC000563 TaxID=3154366 RepID=UPI00331FAEBC